MTLEKELKEYLLLKKENYNLSELQMFEDIKYMLYLMRERISIPIDTSNVDIPFVSKLNEIISKYPLEQDLDFEYWSKNIIDAIITEESEYDCISEMLHIDSLWDLIGAEKSEYISQLHPYDKVVNITGTQIHIHRVINL